MADEQTRDVADVFDSWADEGRDEGMAERHWLTAGRVLDAIELGPGTRFLDLGTGNAWAAQYAAEQGAIALGLDAAPRMLARARQRTRGVELALADFTALPLADGSIDVAFSMEALYYAGDLDQALREAHRVLAPGGRLHALIDYYEGNPASRGWPEKTGVEMHRLSDDQWARGLERAGFADVETSRVRADDERVDDWKAEHGSLYVAGARA